MAAYTMFDTYQGTSAGPTDPFGHKFISSSTSDSTQQASSLMKITDKEKDRDEAPMYGRRRMIYLKKKFMF